MSEETHSEIIRELESVKKDLKTLKVISTCLLIMVFLLQIQNLVSSSNRAPSSHVKFDTQNNQFIQERWVKVIDCVIFRRNIPTHWENRILEILMSGRFRGEKGTHISLDRKTAQHLGMWKTASFWNGGVLWYLWLGIPYPHFTALLLLKPPYCQIRLKIRWNGVWTLQGGENSTRQRCGRKRLLCPLMRFKSFQAGRPI